MSEISIKVTGIDKLYKKLGAVQGAKFHRALLQAAGKHLKSKVSRYPEQKSVTRSEAFGKPFQSDKQRNWFFASLKDGTLKIPYKRTGNLGRKWYVRPLAGFKSKVGNPVSYGDYIQGSGQSRMMELIGWSTLEDVAEKEKGGIERAAQRIVEYALRK